MALKVEWTVVSNCSTNCYMIYNDETKKGFIVDPGDNGMRIIDKIEKIGYVPECIVLTHGHYDHVGAAAMLSKHFNIPVIIGELDEKMLHDPVDNLSAQWAEEAVTLSADRVLKDEEEIELAGYSAKVIHTPGHTPGGICLYFESEGILISGDTLFCESLGRTDFPGGNTRTIIYSIINKLFVLPEETVVYPGHMDETTIGHEKKYNPCARFIGKI